MKKRIMLIGAVAGCLTASAQTMKIQVGAVTYLVPAAQAGNMHYLDGTTLAVMGQRIAIDDIDNVTVDDTEVTDNAVSVAYSGTGAQVLVPGNAMRNLTVTVSGADVSIIQSDNVSEEITYTLTGSSTDGSFFMDGSYKATVVLDNLTLKNADGAAIDIENGKRIDIELVGTNTLADGASGSQKGCMMVNGHAEFKGSGSLSLTGNAKHAYWGDEYVLLKKSMTGTITVENAVKDAFNINEHFEQRGGNVVIKNCGDDGIQVSYEDKSNPTDDDTGSIILSGGTLNVSIVNAASKGLKAEGNILVNEAYAAPTITVTTSGGGVWDSDDSKTKACAGLSSDAHITIEGGTLNLTSSGAGGKGMKCDGVMTVSGGKVTIKTTGNRYAYGNNGNREGKQYRDYRSSAKGMKSDGDMVISGGTVNVTTTGTYAEGIESKEGCVYIKDGTVNVYAYDDGINASAEETGHLYLQGGTVTVYSVNNDGLDSNGNLYVQGGTTVAYGLTRPECGIDANEEQDCTVYFTGGNLFAIGESNSTPSNSESTQYYIQYSKGSVSANTTATVKSGTTTLATFTLPYAASSKNILVTAQGMKSGTYTLTVGSTSKDYTTTQYSENGGFGPGGGGGGGWGPGW